MCVFFPPSLSSIFLHKPLHPHYFSQTHHLSLFPQPLAMDYLEKLLEFRHHIIGALLIFLGFYIILHLSPGFFTVLAYFWPLLVSTTFVITLVFIFAKTSPPPITDASLSKHGEELLYYVAGHPQQPLDHPPPLEHPPNNKSD